MRVASRTGKCLIDKLFSECIGAVIDHIDLGDIVQGRDVLAWHALAMAKVDD